MSRLRTGLVGIFCAMLSVVTAQRGVELGGWLGATHYFGDLNTEYDLSSPGPAGGFIYRYNFNERLAVKFSGNAGLIRGDDAKSDNVFEQSRNIHFRSLVLDGSLQFEFNFLPYIHGSGENGVTPYLFAGLSGLRYNPQAQLDNGQWVNLQPLGTEGQPPGEEYLRISYGLNYGFGLKFDLDYAWSINIEFSSRYLYTDYLDDVSTTYPDLVTLGAQRNQMAVGFSDPSVPPQIGIPGRQRGNSKDNDTYSFLSFGLLYYFGRVDCPDIGNY